MDGATSGNGDDVLNVGRFRGFWMEPTKSIKGEPVDIQFVWGESTSTVLRDVLESQIREDVDTDPDLRPYHPGIITAHIRTTDPLEVSIKGQLMCNCGKSLATFSGLSDGARLTWTYHV